MNGGMRREEKKKGVKLKKTIEIELFLSGKGTMSLKIRETWES